MGSLQWKPPVVVSGLPRKRASLLICCLGFPHWNRKAVIQERTSRQVLNLLLLSHLSVCWSWRIMHFRSFRFSPCPSTRHKWCYYGGRELWNWSTSPPLFSNRHLRLHVLEFVYLPCKSWVAQLLWPLYERCTYLWEYSSPLSHHFWQLLFKRAQFLFLQPIKIWVLSLYLEMTWFCFVWLLIQTCISVMPFVWAETWARRNSYSIR